MDIEGELFDKESSTVELIVEDILFDTSEDLQKTLFASLDSIIVPLSPRPAPRVVANKIDNDVPSSDELDGTSAFTSTSTAGSNGQLKHLVGSHELGLSIQQETPQLLMEGDTLDDQDTSIVQEDAMSPFEQDFTKTLVPVAVDTTHQRTNDIDRLPMKVSKTPVLISSQSTNSVNAPLESNCCMGTSGKVTASTPAAHTSSFVAHVSSPPPVTSSSSVSNLTSLMDHVSSPLVTMNSSIVSPKYSPNTISCALRLLAGAPYSVISSAPISLNKPVTNEVALPSSPSTMLSTTSPMSSSTSSSIQSSTVLSTSSSMPSSSIQSSTLSSFHHCDTTDNTVNLAPIAKNGAGSFCDDDIISQSLMLAHNAVHPSPDQLLASHDPPCQESHEQPPECTTSHDQRGSHDQHSQLGSHDQPMDWEVGCPGSHDAHDGVTKSTASIIPSKITFIDWTEMKRKYATPSYYPSTPTPITIRLDQDTTIHASRSKKKKKINANATGKKRGWVKGRPRKIETLKSIIKHIPKPPRSGYMHYLSDHRSEVMKNNPNMSVGEVSNYLGKKWSHLPAEQRQSYLNKGYMDRQRYIQELVTYYQQKNNDFQQQDATFDPEWATKYLTQYLNNNSDDVLYCPVCDVQFSSLHNKQQHCLSRKHNGKVVKFVQESVRDHQKENGNVSTSPTHPANINSENCARDHLSINTNSVDHIASTEDSIADHMSNNVDHLSSNVDHHVSDTEDHVRINTSDAKDHKRGAEHHVSSTEDHVGATKDSTGNVNHHTRDSEDCINLSSRENSLSSDTMGNPNACANASNGTTADSPTCSSVDHSNNAEVSSVSCHISDPDCIILTDTENNLSGDRLSGTNACARDNVILTDSSVDHSNNAEVSVEEGPCDQPFVSFPPYYGLNHLMHDFTLHQQGMLNSLSETNSQLHSRHAQLQGDGNELEAQVKDMEKQLQCSRQESIDLLSQLETLSHMMHSIGQEDNA